jgi:hypothetical protein
VLISKKLALNGTVKTSSRTAFPSKNRPNLVPDYAGNVEVQFAQPCEADFGGDGYQTLDTVKGSLGAFVPVLEIFQDRLGQFD